MQDPVHRPGLPYGAILTHGYPRGIYVAVAALGSFIAGIVVANVW